MLLVANRTRTTGSARLLRRVHPPQLAQTQHLTAQLQDAVARSGTLAAAHEIRHTRCNARRMTFTRSRLFMTPLMSCALGCVTLASSCVSQGQFDAKVAELEDTRTRLAAAENDARVRAQSQSDLQARFDNAQKALSSSKQLTDELLAKLEAVNTQTAELQRMADERQSVVGELQTQLEEQRKLLSEFESLAREHGAKNPHEFARSLAELRNRVKQTEVALKIAASELEREKRIADKLKALIDAGTLSVHRRSGRLVIELPGDIHFDAGKAVLTKVGESTLAQLATVLTAESDRLFVVEGHTDNQPIKRSGFRSNWHLGSTRAEVAREALVAGGLNSQHVAIASWADLLPACTESQQPECLQRNRRVEVMLLPRFE